MASQKKKTYVSDLSAFLTEAKHFALIKFDNTSHLTLEKLRKELKKEGSSFKVVKNTLLEKTVEALSKKQKHLKKLAESFPLRENSAILALSENYSSALGAFFRFAKAEKTLGFKVGVLDEVLYTGSDLEKIAQLPDHNTLIAKLIGGMQTPSSKLVYSMKFNVSKFVYILKERGKQAN